MVFNHIIYINKLNKMAEDKIINNSFNTGDRNYEDFYGTIKVDNRVSSLYEDQLGDNIEGCHIIKMLDDEIYKLFLESPYYQKYKNPKRIDKGDISKMYYYFKNELVKQKKFSPSEIFIAFAEFFQVNYEILYTEVGILDKESLLKELNDKYHLNSKFKNKKLF